MFTPENLILKGWWNTVIYEVFISFIKEINQRIVGISGISNIMSDKGEENIILPKMMKGKAQYKRLNPIRIFSNKSDFTFGSKRAMWEIDKISDGKIRKIAKFRYTPYAMRAAMDTASITK